MKNARDVNHVLILLPTIKYLLLSVYYLSMVQDKNRFVALFHKMYGTLIDFCFLFSGLEQSDGQWSMPREVIRLNDLRGQIKTFR